MSCKWISTLVILMALFIWNCEATDSDADLAELETTLMLLLDADDSTFSIDGYGNGEDLDYSLERLETGLASTTDAYERLDNLYIWRFGRSGMQKTRDVSIEQTSDSTAMATINHHVTGTFHVRQFERIWHDDGTWERGDSIRFSEKPIDLTIVRQVRFAQRETVDGQLRWRIAAFTPAYGVTADCPLAITRLEWIAEDSIRFLDDFQNTFFELPLDLEFATLGVNEVRLYATNEIEGEAEAITGRWHIHPNMNGPQFHRQLHFQYLMTNNDGEKIYSRMIETPQRPNRRFNCLLEAIDLRTLYDHDYPTYEAASLGLNYWLRRHAGRH